MIRHAIVAATLAIQLLATAYAAQPLQMKVYNADANSFNVSSTLIFGETEAMVIDAGFTRADALRIAANVLDSGKTLRTIYVSQADPDYYFGVEHLKAIFPDADVVTTPAVLEKMVANKDAKVAFWGPKMGGNAPRNPVLPRAMTENTLKVDDQIVEIRGTEGALAHRPYAWIPSLEAIVGNIGVSNGLHVWTADTQTPTERGVWVTQLNEMAALKPKVVVPGHMKANSAMDASAIAFTKDYLLQFEQNLAASKDSAELIKSMQNAYPDLSNPMSLELGAKVNTGEMKW